MGVGPGLTLTPTTAPLGFDLRTTVTALLTMALLTMALLTMALLTMALLTMTHHGHGAHAGAWSAERGPQCLRVWLAVSAARQQEDVEAEQLRGDEVAEIVGLEEHDLVMVGAWAWV